MKEKELRWDRVKERSRRWLKGKSREGKKGEKWSDIRKRE